MEEYDEIKDMKHLAWFIGTSIVVIVIGLYVLLHKEIKAVENRFVPLEEQASVLSDSQKKNEEYKLAIQECHKQAIKDARKIFNQKWDAVKDSTDSDFLEKVLTIYPFFFLNAEIKNNMQLEKGQIKNTIYYPDYEQYYTICLREKGYVE